ncbi:MAG TPA: DUF4097 family beta strand repeat-containing protein [Terriglobia bacterium]|nr:DUF4097 family beta strand repeat-containing protein [Terriglobia bacterium]
MKTKRTGLLMVALMAISVAAFADSRIEKTLSLEPGGKFVLQTDAGSVTVTGSSASGARVVITSNRDDLESLFNFDFNSSAGLAQVTARKKTLQWFSNVNLHFDVTVPSQTGLSIKTSGGSVKVTSLQGEQDLRTSGGSIDASEVRGNLMARTSGGSISVRDVTGNADLGTSGGGITVNSLNGSLQAGTSGGPIHIDGVTGRAVAHTSGGSIQAAFARGNNQGGELTTSGGSIRASLDPTANLDIDASTSGGSVSTDMPLRVQGTISQSKVHGTLGSGGQTLQLHTSGGSIRIASL